MTKKREGQGAQQIGEIMGDLVAQAQAKAALPPPKRQTKKITPAGLILTGADQKLIEASAEIAITPPTDQHTKLKIYAAKQGKTIKELLTEYVAGLPE